MRRVRAALNPALDIEGVLLTMFDERTNLGQQVAADVRQFFKEKVFRTVIPRNVRLGEAPSHGMPVMLYDVKSRGAEAYLALAREVLERSATDCRVTAEDCERCHANQTTRARQRPERADSRRARTAHDADRSRHRSPGRRTTFSRARRSTMDGSTSWRSRSRRTASFSRSSSARSATSFKSSPASAAGAPRSAPGSLRVPVVVRDVAQGREQSLLEMALIENIQREDLNPIDEALAYRRLTDEFQLTQEEIAAAVGKDRASVANYLRLLKLPDEVRAEVAAGRLSMGHARALLALDGRSRPAPRCARRHRPEPVGPRDRSRWSRKLAESGTPRA